MNAEYADLAAVVVAGGRSSRLRESAPAGTPAKTLLRNAEGTRLVDAAIAAAAGVGAGRIVVVGPDRDGAPVGGGGDREDVRDRGGDCDRRVELLAARESPPFSGPAAAIAAGLAALWPGADGERTSSPAVDSVVLVVGGDMPAAGPALSALLDALGAAPPSTWQTSADRTAAESAARASEATDGAIAVVDGRRQPLLAALRAPAALRAFSGDCAGASVHRLLSALELAEVDVPAGAAADIDTWADARTLGFDAP